MTMECKMLMLMLLLSLGLQMRVTVNAAEPQVPCFFIFGDSLSDVGNNNNLPVSIAKANFLPYGIDFPKGATGRFCNGRNPVDFIGQFLGFNDFIPSFPKSFKEGAVKGVNYASSSAGINKHTGFEVGQNICIDEQLANHQTTITQLTNALGGQKNATSLLNKCLYSMFIGTNDWLLDYFNPTAGANTIKYPPSSYADMLVSKLTDQLTSLHEMGARKVVLFGLSPLGCAPPLHLLGKCLQTINDAVLTYNNKLKSLVEKLNKQFEDSKFIFVNTYDIFGKDLSGLGLPVKYAACCRTIGPTCIPLSIPCSDRSRYVFWDHIHPTEAANKVFASRAFEAQAPNDTYPMDISHLVALKL